jgi:hypothetical protein
MKKIITLLVLFVSTVSFAQLADCRDFPNPNFPQPPSSIYSRSTLATPPSSNKYVFSIKFHIVKNTDGTGSTSAFGENEVLNAIMILNTTYNPYNIFFKYIGYDVILNSDYMLINSQTGAVNVSTATLHTFSELITYSQTGMANPVYDYNAMNIFIVDKLDEHSTTLQAQTAGVAYRPGVNSAFTNNYFLTSTLPHEIGHNFNLLHTHQNWNTVNCEHVSGDNSDTAGDLVIDTPASYPFSNTNFSASCSYINPTNAVDCIGTTFANCPVKNFMSSNNNCRQLGTEYLPGNAVFSNGQANRMREQINTYYNNSSNTYGYYNAKNTIESLYEPYAKNPILGDIVSITDDGILNGMSIVCRRLSGYTYKFQKGFNYTFNTFGTTNNHGVTEIPSYPDFGTLTITQLNTTYEHPFGEICYRGTKLCSLEAMEGGKIYTTQYLGSTNITEKILTPQDLENPNLVNELPNQTYNILIQETTSGDIKSEIIYKGN